MATKEPKTTRLVHVNGATVEVDSEKAERLLAGVNFSKASARSTKSD